ILHTDMPGQDGPHPLSFYQGDSITYVDVSMSVLDFVSIDHGYIGELSDPINFDMDSLFNKSYFDTPGEFQHDGGLYAHDLKKVVDTDGFDMLNELYFNQNIYNFQYRPDSTGDKIHKTEVEQQVLLLSVGDPKL
ncbi:hypothetical protein Tco_1514091, partial [Tanacetum coccineum]